MTTNTKVKGATKRQEYRFKNGCVYLASEFGIITELRVSGSVTLQDLKDLGEDL